MGMREMQKNRLKKKVAITEDSRCLNSVDRLIYCVGCDCQFQFDEKMMSNLCKNCTPGAVSETC